MVILSEWKKGSRQSVFSHKRLFRKKTQETYKLWQDTETEEIQSDFHPYLPVGSGDIKILDVGAGPFCLINRNHQGKVIERQPIDALADSYLPILKEQKIEPSTPTRQMFAEEIPDYFPESYFDIAYTCNALDHTMEPQWVLFNMMWVTKPEGYIIIRTFINEADRQNGGLHNWNLYEQAGDLFLRAKNDTRETNLSQYIGMYAKKVSLETRRQSNHRHYLWVVFRKEKME